MNESQNQSNSADESYRKIFETLNASEEGRAFLGAFLKKHRRASGQPAEPLSPARPRLVADNTVSPSPHVPGQAEHGTESAKRATVLSPATTLPHLQSTDGGTEEQAGLSSRRTSNNPVLFALRELADSLKKTEAENKKARQIATDIRKLAELLDKQAVPTAAGQLLRTQAKELDRLIKSRQQSSWQIAKVVQVLHILENYVRQESIAKSS